LSLFNLLHFNKYFPAANSSTEQQYSCLPHKVGSFCVSSVSELKSFIILPSSFGFHKNCGGSCPELPLLLVPCPWNE